jgi:hypothetical protein
MLVGPLRALEAERPRSPAEVLVICGRIHYASLRTKWAILPQHYYRLGCPRALSQGLDRINCVYNRSASLETHGKELAAI